MAGTVAHCFNNSSITSSQGHISLINRLFSVITIFDNDDKKVAHFSHFALIPEIRGGVTRKVNQKPYRRIIVQGAMMGNDSTSSQFSCSYSYSSTF